MEHSSRYFENNMQLNPLLTEFASAQVAKGLPTVVTIASRNQEVALRAQALLSTSRFRCYTTDDIEGTYPSRNVEQITSSIQN